MSGEINSMGNIEVMGNVAGYTHFMTHLLHTYESYIHTSILKVFDF